MREFLGLFLVVILLITHLILAQEQTQESIAPSETPLPSPTLEATFTPLPTETATETTTAIVSSTEAELDNNFVVDEGHLLQRPKPRPFYCAAYADDDYSEPLGFDMTIDNGYWRFYTFPNVITISSDRLYLPPSDWEW